MTAQQPFYREGLYFSCTRCSACCRYESGYVYLSENDILLLAKECQMEYTELVKTYCRWVDAEHGEHLSLKEKANNDCVFWDKGCTVYNARPLQCRTFPFWPSIMRSEGAWKMAAGGCPGMNTGALHRGEAIDGMLSRRAAEPLILKKSAGGIIQ